jgi:hypothetical protein
MNNLNFWNPEDFEISSYKYGLKERVNKKYTTSGADNTGKCLYSYNELGFRGDSIHKEGFKIMSLGCSFTEGVGVNDDETWPSKFTTNILDGVNLNFGTGGRSNDFIARCLLSYYDLIKPNLVLIMYTVPHRREFFTKEGGIEPYIPSLRWGYFSETEDGIRIQKNKEEIQNDYNDIQNWFKNHLLITYFLKYKKTPFIWNGSWLNIDYQDDFRFDGDYENFVDLGVDNKHAGPIHNELYSKKLYNFITKNHPQYL